MKIIIFHVSIETWKLQAVSVSEERKKENPGQLTSEVVPLSSRPSFNLVVVSRYIFCGFYAIYLSSFSPYSFPQLVTRVGRIWIIGLSWIAMCRY